MRVIYCNISQLKKQRSIIFLTAVIVTCVLWALYKYSHHITDQSLFSQQSQNLDKFHGEGKIWKSNIYKHSKKIMKSEAYQEEVIVQETEENFENNQEHKYDANAKFSTEQDTTNNSLDKASTTPQDYEQDEFWKNIEDNSNYQAPANHEDFLPEINLTTETFPFNNKSIDLQAIKNIQASNPSENYNYPHHNENTQVRNREEMQVSSDNINSNNALVDVNLNKYNRLHKTNQVSSSNVDTNIQSFVDVTRESKQEHSAKLIEAQLKQMREGKIVDNKIIGPMGEYEIPGSRGINTNKHDFDDNKYTNNQQLPIIENQPKNDIIGTQHEKSEKLETTNRNEIDFKNLTDFKGHISPPTLQNREVVQNALDKFLNKEKTGEETSAQEPYGNTSHKELNQLLKNIIAPKGNLSTNSKAEDDKASKVVVEEAVMRPNHGYLLNLLQKNMKSAPEDKHVPVADLQKKNTANKEKPGDIHQQIINVLKLSDEHIASHEEQIQRAMRHSADQFLDKIQENMAAIEKEKKQEPVNLQEMPDNEIFSLQVPEQPVPLSKQEVDREINQEKLLSPFVTEKMYDRVINTFDITDMKFLPNYKNPCWYEASESTVSHLKQLHCLPYFFLAGVESCGEKLLIESLKLHHQIVSPIFDDPNWWSYKRLQGASFGSYIDSYDHTASVLQRSISRYQNGTLVHNCITYDASPNLLLPFLLWHAYGKNMDKPEHSHLFSPFQIKRILPNAKFVILLCDPIERLYSWYYNNPYGLPDSLKSPEDFDHHVENAIEWIYNCSEQHKKSHICHFGQVPDRDSISRHIDPFITELQTGFYGFILQQWRESFHTTKNLKLVKSWDLANNRVLIIQEIVHFLGLEPLSDNEQSIIKLEQDRDTQAGINPFQILKYKPPMLMDTRHKLQSLYKFSDQYLASLVGKLSLFHNR